MKTKEEKIRAALKNSNDSLDIIALRYDTTVSFVKKIAKKIKANTY